MSAPCKHCGNSPERHEWREDGRLWARPQFWSGPWPPAGSATGKPDLPTLERYSHAYEPEGTES